MSIQYKVSSASLGDDQTAVLVIPLYDDLNLGIALPDDLRTVIAQTIETLEFKASWGSCELVPFSNSHFSYTFISLVGLGARNRGSTHHSEGLRRALGRVATELRRHRLRSLTIGLQNIEAVEPLAQATVEALELANYRFTDYMPKVQREHEKRSLQTVTLIVSSAEQEVVYEHVNQVVAVAEGVELTRHLVNQPGSAISPKALVDVATRIAHDHSEITTTILDRHQAEQQNFNAFLAVARGSVHEPYVIHMEYKHPQAKKKIMIVGKGVTFDSGGLSIKPAEMMDLMKIDMAGAAAVLGLFAVLPQLDLQLEIHGIIATCENMPSGSAYRPGDIVRSKSGKTIEIINTDAEGRVTMADALTYAVEHKPDVILDIATLTGACMVALGETVAGLWSNRPELADELLYASKQTGEQLALLPLPEEYTALNESKVADLRNLATSKFGGAITAALFLREFVGDIPWAHMDIAAPAYIQGSSLPYYEPGATGFGVRLLVQFLKNTQA